MADSFAVLRQSPSLHVARVGAGGLIRGAVLGALIGVGLFAAFALGAGIFAASIPSLFTSTTLLGGLICGGVGATVGSLVGAATGVKSALNEHRGLRNGTIDPKGSAHLLNLYRGLMMKDAKKLERQGRLKKPDHLSHLTEAEKAEIKASAKEKVSSQTTTTTKEGDKRAAHPRHEHEDEPHEHHYTKTEKHVYRHDGPDDYPRNNRDPHSADDYVREGGHRRDNYRDEKYHEPRARRDRARGNRNDGPDSRDFRRNDRRDSRPPGNGYDDRHTSHQDRHFDRQREPGMQRY